MNSNKTVIGLTGGIASGKTVVSDYFATLGAEIIDADVISREISSRPDICQRLIKAFPSAVSNGEICRAKLREIVFNNSVELNKLNEIMHPAIVDEVFSRANLSNANVVVVVAPLLFEVGLDKGLRPIICVTADDETRIKRLVKRDDITKELALNMINSQTTNAERESKSDILIINDGDVTELKRKALQVFNQIKGL